MKFARVNCITAIGLLTLLVCPVQLDAQEQNKHQPRKEKHHHYQLIDLGTFGGPHSYGSVNGDGFQLLNNSGVVASYADLSVPDPNAAFFCYDSDCFQAHASQWRDGVITDLGALPVNNNSAAGSINSRGWSTGQSQSATIDPVVGIPEFRGVLWKHGQIIDLGTLDSGTESLGIYVNDAGQVVGFSTINTNPDPVGFFGFPTHTFIWQNGEKLDIGTLGGANAFPGASCSNQPKDLVVGGSTTTTTVNPSTGLPDVDPFLWHKGKMIDLGTLGGTNGFAQCANHRHQVIGMSSLAANPAACDFPAFNAGGPGCHAFFWEDGVIKDLGTLGGDNSEAIWLNEDGDVVGSADLAGPTGNQTHDAVLWRNGMIHDLGTVTGDPCSRGRGLNSRGQVVGGSSDCRNFLHAFVWEEGGPMLDLNRLIAPGSGYQLTNAFNVNDRGEILAKAAPLGFRPNDDADLGHLVLLIPCDENHSGVEGCNYDPVDADRVARENPASVIQEPITAASRTGLDFGRPGLTFGPGHFRVSRQRLGTRCHLSSPTAANEGSSCEKTSMTSSSYAPENVISDYAPEVRRIPRGYCSAPGGLLTGYCLGVRGGICREAYDPTRCPPGHKAKTRGSFPCGSSGKLPVDISTACTP